MKICNKCGATIADDNARFCLECGTECTTTANVDKKRGGEEAKEGASLLGDKNIVSDSTIIGKQEKYEASNITINNTTIEDHSHTTIVCAVSGKRVYMDNSVVCPQCGKSVATEYYNEAARRCAKCDEAAVELFRGFATQLLAGGSLEAKAKASLEAKGRELLLDEELQRAILREVQRSGNSRDMVLSAVQQAELEAAVERLMRATSSEECISALGMFKALHDMSQNYTVEFWYYLSRAVADPQRYIAEYEEEIADNYWQRYWGFLAYTITANSKSVAAIERLRKSFGEREHDVCLAEAAYFIARGFENEDTKMVKMAAEKIHQIDANYLSKPLMFVYATLKRLTVDGLRLDVGYSAEEQFTILNILRAGRVIEGLRAEEAAERARIALEEAKRARAEREAAERAAQAERERKEREERERKAQEAKRLAEEAKRKAQEEALRAEHKSRMEEEKARLAGKPAAKRDDKAFVGYEAETPKKKSKVGRILLIVVVLLILAIGVLFLIPAPDSMQ